MKPEQIELYRTVAAAGGVLATIGLLSVLYKEKQVLPTVRAHLPWTCSWLVCGRCLDGVSPRNLVGQDGRRG